MAMRGTELGRVRGLGAARAGAHHFWTQRATAVANLLLLAWFVVSLLRLPRLDYFTVANWLSQPIAAIPMLLLIWSVFNHFRAGVQTMLEDYIPAEGRRRAALLALDFYVVAGGVAAAFAILKLAIGGPSA
jgi:succinate dehydrogenase / fumarate reductase membrane anchor subunit